MTYGSLWARLVKGTSWIWLSDRHRSTLPDDLSDRVMDFESRDRFHAKQGRSTARVVFHSPSGSDNVSVYLKRHYTLPWRARLGALVYPRGRHTPASAEWAHLERVRTLGIDVPEVVAAGERIGPWGTLTSFLMVAELMDCLPLNEAIPILAHSLEPKVFEKTKRTLIAVMARITAKLHTARLFHKDLYLCHFYLNMRFEGVPNAHLTLIDLHRLGEHRWLPDRWFWKDLAQLLFSTYDVEGIDDRDRARFWRYYRREMKLPRAEWHQRMIELKAARYLAHNRQEASNPGVSESTIKDSDTSPQSRSSSVPKAHTPRRSTATHGDVASS